MVEIIVFAEGQTEEQFIKRLVAPALRPLQIFVKPQLLKTSKDGKGGAVSYDRLKFNVRNTLKGNREVVLSTFLDLYALDKDFPNIANAKMIHDVYGKVACLENALHEEMVEYIECRPERFLPHIQPYEFEGLLFSNVEALSRAEPDWKKHLSELTKVREAFESPEHINDGYETKPSKRLGNLLQPKYKKTRHGPLAAEHITLAVMERECAHFREWMERLRKLAVS